MTTDHGRHWHDGGPDWAARDRRARNGLLIRNYGFGVEEYERMLANQNGVCAICDHPPALGKKLNVDHDHATDLIRGLLCIRCNCAAGDYEHGLIKFSHPHFVRIVNYVDNFRRIAGSL